MDTSFRDVVWTIWFRLAIAMNASPLNRDGAIFPRPGAGLPQESGSVAGGCTRDDVSATGASQVIALGCLWVNAGAFRKLA